MEQSTYNIENAQSQMRKGFLEFPVLLIIGTRDRYASEILEELRKNNLLVVEGTLYPLLSRLKRQGLLTYLWQESESGPPRKYYQLTKEGTKIAEDLQQSWKEFGSSINNLVKTYEKNN